MPEKDHHKSRPGIPLLHRHLRQLHVTSHWRSTKNLVLERLNLAISKLKSLRWVTVVLGIGNSGLVLLGLYLMVFHLFGCSGEVKLPFAVVSLVAGIRIMCTVGAGFAQVATAATIVNYPIESDAVVDAVIRHERRMRYRRWLWWSRFGVGVTILQFVGALYLTFITVKNFSYDEKSRECFLGWDVESRGRKWILMVSFVIVAWLVVIIQCFTGSDVLRWRSFYATHDIAWKAHYLEVFDHGIREALCCLGRVKYLSVLEEDEVYSVAQLLGDLVAYRATGTGHLEFFAGLALLQRHRQSTNFHDDLVEAPQPRISDAATFHQFAEAAYTGPLLDFGRNPLLFPCAWLYRQGILTPWARNRRPVLEGDNWWRGHAAAFLKYVNLLPHMLRQGRVRQTKREAAYFIVVLHHLKSVVIAVRGTETPEDLLTDVLCRECALTRDDLDGLINSDHLEWELREKVLSSFPHYGHSGIVESARELFMQIEGIHEVKDGYPSETTGFLSSLLGNGRECHGYRVCIVGHSMGGSVATLLGIRLYRHYPNLHVYSYGTLPCVDSVVAEACSGFVTCIVYNDEFSARLSVNSIIRLQTAAISALSNDSLADSDMVHKFAQRILLVNNHHERREDQKSTNDSTLKVVNNNGVHRRNIACALRGGGFLCAHAVSCMVNMPDNRSCLHPKKTCSETSSGAKLEAKEFSDQGGSEITAGAHDSIKDFHSREETSLIDRSFTDIGRTTPGKINQRDTICCNDFEKSEGLISIEDHKSDVSSQSIEISIEDPPEMFLPGLIIHIIPEERSILPLWRRWTLQDTKQGYRAVVAKREHFKDIVVTPYMFLDHLPWRCHYAMQRVLETRNAEGHLADNLLNGVHAI